MPSTTSDALQEPSFADSAARFDFRNGPITAPVHSWFTSPARSHPNAAQAKELPLHLIQLILTYLDDVGDLARITRTSRLFYYMTLPRLYENVTLRAYSELRLVDGKPEGYGNGSPFAMGLNTLVTRSFGEYIQSFRIIGEWQEHDAHEYEQGRVPDNSMVLQIVLRAALDKMKNLTAFAWELNIPPMFTVFQGLATHTSLTSLILRCQTKRTPRPTTTITPFPNLITLIVYDIDPLCYPEDISMLLLGSKKLQNLKLHWSPRMRENGEESVNLLTLFGRCIAAQYTMRLKRIAIYNLYTRLPDDGFDDVMDHSSHAEITVINSFNSSDPKTVFVDNAWNLHRKHPVPFNLKMYRTDYIEKLGAIRFGKFTGLERLYLVSGRRNKTPPNTSSATVTPSSPSGTPSQPNGSMLTSCIPSITRQECKNMGSDYLAVIQTNHRTMRHLLLSDHWQLSEDALLQICQACPHLEQLGFSCGVPPFHVLRKVIGSVPKLFAIRMLVREGSEFADKLDSMGDDMHIFVLATEFWRPEYMNLKYFGMGDKRVYKLGKVFYPQNYKQREKAPEGQQDSLNARRAGPVRKIELVTWEDVKHVEIWGMDNTDFEPSFP